MLIILVIVVAFVFLTAAFRSKIPRRVAKYLPAKIMTENEKEFFGRLTRALPDLHVFPQVSMAALIKPVQSFKDNKTAYWSINQKRVDFAIYTKQIDLVCIVELDDATHNPGRDAERDAKTVSAGIKTIRWQSKTKPNESEIQRQISAFQTVSQNHRSGA